MNNFLFLFLKLLVFIPCFLKDLKTFFIQSLSLDTNIIKKVKKKVKKVTIMNDTKIYQKMKRKSLLHIKNIEWQKMPYHIYKKLLSYKIMMKSIRIFWKISFEAINGTENLLWMKQSRNYNLKKLYIKLISLFCSEIIIHIKNFRWNRRIYVLIKEKKIKIYCDFRKR